jgi:hypothetical protein
MLRDGSNGSILGLPAAVGVAVPWHRCRDGPAIGMGVVGRRRLYIQMKRRPERPPGTLRRGRHKLAPCANGAMALVPDDPSCPMNALARSPGALTTIKARDHSQGRAGPVPSADAPLLLRANSCGCDLVRVQCMRSWRIPAILEMPSSICSAGGSRPRRSDVPARRWQGCSECLAVAKSIRDV